MRPVPQPRVLTFWTGAILIFLAQSALAQNISRVVPWPTKTYQYSIESNVLYGQGERSGGGVFTNLYLDLHIPSVTPPEGAVNQFPLVVMLGRDGRKDEGRLRTYAGEYAQRGWLVATIEYRDYNVNPVPSSRVEALYDYLGGASASLWRRADVAAVDDLLIALEFLQAREDVYTPWTVLFGLSSGASASLITAYSLDDHGIARPPVAAVLSHWGSLRNSSVGNPFDSANSNDPVLMVVHGTADNTIPYSEATEIQAWALEAGLPLDFQPVEGAGHSILLPILTATTGVTMLQRGPDYLDEMLFDGLEWGSQPPLPPGC